MNSRSGTVTGIHKRWLVAKRVILMVAWLSAVAVVVNADDVGEDDGTTTATSTPTSTATTSTLCERTMEDDDGEEEMQRTHWISGDLAWGVAGASCWLAVLISLRQIYMHLSYYNKPEEQKWIVRIVFMVPIYSICSWLSLRYYENSVYIDGVRNVYEALVIYYFLSLCYQFIGGESAILAQLGQDAENKPRCSTCTCCLDPFPYDLNFLRYCKQGCLQFCIVKPLMSVIAMIAHALGHYEEGDTSPKGAYLWVSLCYNISIAIALFSLVLFYAATADLLGPHRPVLKFFVVKAVIFFAFWQSMVLSFGEKLGYVGGTHYCDISAAEIALCWQNFLICNEMFLAAVAMYYAFTYKIYMSVDGEDGGEGGAAKRPTKTGSVAANFRKAISPKDVIDDTFRNFSNKYGKYARQGDDDGFGLVESGDEDEGEGAGAGTAAPDLLGGDITSLGQGRPINASAGGADDPFGAPMGAAGNNSFVDAPFGASAASPMAAAAAASNDSNA